MKPLFIPLKRQYFLEFASGAKDEEFRPLGPRWNERTCPPGRPVVLSLGYGKHQRRSGRIVEFRVSLEPTTTEAWRDCYGTRYPNGPAACIRILLDPPTGESASSGDVTPVGFKY